MTEPKKKQHTIEDTIAEMKAVSEWDNAGSWQIIVQVDGQPVAHFVRNSETDQYNLLTEDKYKTEQRANLALAILSRPTQLTHQERVALLEILLDKE